jgi:prephenate dehydratase
VLTGWSTVYSLQQRLSRCSTVLHVNPVRLQLGVPQTYTTRASAELQAADEKAAAAALAARQLAAVIRIQAAWRGFKVRCILVHMSPLV